MTELLIAALIVAAPAGFFAGLAYAGRHVPHMLARLSPEQIADLARQTRLHRELDQP